MTLWQIAARCALGAAVLATTTLGWTAERGPTRHAAQAQDTSEGARVIVRYRSTSSTTASGRATAQAASSSGAQRASELAGRTGLSLRDGRAMGEREQLVHASGMSSAALAARLAQDAQVEWAVPDRRRRATYTPNDPYFASGLSDPMPPAGQWWLRPYDSTLVAASAMSNAWARSVGNGQVVAVLDTGVRFDHPDLAGRLLPGYNMVSKNTSADGTAAAGKCISGNGSCREANASDPGDWVDAADVKAYPKLFTSDCISDSSWHGTQVSGIVGATTANGVGVAGSAFGAAILPVRVLGKCGGWDSDIIDGIRWAAGLTVSGVPTNKTPARVINLSLGGSGSCGSAYQAAINEVISQTKAVVVVAAGNDGDAVGAPGNCSGVLTVAGLRHVGTKVGYSSLGSEVGIAAPAGNCVNETGACLYPIVTTSNGGTTTPGSAIYTDAYNSSLGTSFATPMVAGAAALVLAADPSLSSAAAISVLKDNARTFPTTGGDASSPTCRAPDGFAQDSECYCTTSTCGAGMLDAFAAVAAVRSGATPIALVTPDDVLLRKGQAVALRSTLSRGGTDKVLTWQVLSGSATLSATDAATPTLTATATGAVKVRLTVSNGSGSDSADLTLLAAAGPSASFSAPSLAVGDSATLDGSGSSTDTGVLSAWQWAVTAGTGSATLASATSETATLTGVTAGTVTVTLTVTDSSGRTDSSSHSVTVTGSTDGSGGTGGSGSSSGGGAWSPLWGLGLLFAGLALRRRVV